MNKHNIFISLMIISSQLFFACFVNAETISATSFFALTNGYSSRACYYATSEAWDKAREKCGDEGKEMKPYGSTCSDDILTLALSATATVRFSCK